MSKVTKLIKNHLFEVVLVVPMTLYILGFTVFPILKTIIMGFTDKYTGKFTLENYYYLFGRPAFTEAIFNTIVFTLISLCFQFVVALGIAMILKQSFPGKGILRALVLMPMGIPTLVSGVIALYMFGASGYMNEVLFRLGIIETPIIWTTGGLKGLLIVILADTWKVLPTMVLLILAGLEGIPSDLYEAGSIDGAGAMQKFRYITMPLLKSTVTMSLLFRAVDAFRVFEMPQVMVGQALPFLATYAYEEYGTFNNPNASGAASTILLLLILVFALLYLKYIDKGEGFDVGK